jgi:hypothetical protein
MVELALLMAIALSGQFETADVGAGGRLSWRPNSVLGVEAEVTVYPSDFPGSRPFSRGRVEGLFGVTAGPTLGRVRPFAKLRPGFVTIRQTPEPFPCILIYPPPIACALVSGRTLAAIDAGGGVHIAVSSRTFIRADAGDRMVRYPGPVIQMEPRRVRERSFVDHDVRFSVGAGVQF